MVELRVNPARREQWENKKKIVKVLKILELLKIC